MRWAFAVLAAILLLLGPGTVYGSQEPQQLVVKAGESYVLPTTGLERVAVADPSVADVVVASPAEVIINGKVSGVTSLHVWDRDGRRSFIIRVNPVDADAARQISETINVPGVTVKSVKGAIILEGRVPDRKASDRAEKIAKALSDKVVNLLTVEDEGAVPAAAPPSNAKAEKEAADRMESQRLAQVSLDGRKALPERVKAATGLANLKAYVEGETLILDGTASSQVEIDRAAKIAQVMGTGLIKEVVSLMTVAAVELPQVLLQVQVVEIYRDSLDTLGITWGTVEGANTGLVGGSFIIGQQSIYDGSTTSYTPVGQLLPIDARVEALSKNGRAKLLAAPSLVTVSGKPASFLAGGEIPVPIPTKDGITVYWKEYGVKLEMQPEVLSNDKLTVHVKPEVSTLDWANGAKINSGMLPALKTRRAETDVRLVAGETLVIGGLLSSEEAKNTQGLPLLSKLPIIGKLFGSDSFKKGQTELVIFVTPKLVRSSGDVKKETITKQQDLYEASPADSAAPAGKAAPAGTAETRDK
jgi:pilus assembly protein CpaC